MKKIMIIIMLFTTAVNAQVDKSTAAANSILSKVRDKLNSIKHLSYTYAMETRYYAENYHHQRKGSIYFEYTDQSEIGLRFQGSDENFSMIYNGHLTMMLRNDMTIDSANNNAKRMENNSYLYYSIAMLRNVIPLVIQNDSIQKAVRDTLVDGKELYSIKMEGAQMYFGTFTGIHHFTAANLRRPYYLLVDKKSFLPQQFISKYIREEDDRDFAAIVFTNINTNAKPPANNSWEYTAYLDKYKPYIAALKKPVIPIGTEVADFTLPAYTPVAVNNVSLKQYAGKVVLIDFWFKSCGPCMQAMPHYKELQDKLGKDFQLLTINVEDPVDDIKFFYNKHQPNYPMLFNGNKLFESMGLTACPSSVLLDKNGKVVKVFFGFDAAVIENKIKEL